LFTSLNIMGLAIGISICWVVLRIVNYELSFENAVPNKENIYRLSSAFTNEGKVDYNGGVPKPLYQAIRDDIPYIKTVAPIFREYNIASVGVPQTGASARKIDATEELFKVMLVDSAYFSMVPYTWLAGHKTRALSQPDNVVLTAKKAKMYFPNFAVDQIIGQTLVYNDTLSKIVSGIVDELAFPTEFDGSEFFFLKPQNYPLNIWTNTHGSDKVYIALQEGADIAQVTAAINKITDDKWLSFKKESKPTYTYNRKIVTTNLKELHFATHLDIWDTSKTSKTVIYGLVGIALFILLLACINYINLVTAQLPARSKAIAVRKTLGCHNRLLVGQIFMETFITLAISLLLAWVGNGIAFRFFKDLIPAGMASYGTNLTFALIIIMLLVTTGVLASLYPSWLITRVQPVHIFKNSKQFQMGNGQFNFRKSLIVFQFFIAQIFTVSALIIGQQLTYLVHKDMGFEKDAVVTLNLPKKLLNEVFYKDKSGEKTKTLKHELRSLAGVNGVSIGSMPLTDSYFSSSFEVKDLHAETPIRSQLFMKNIDADYIDVFEIPLIAGSNITASDTTNGYLLNESAIQALGFANPQEAIGKYIGSGNGFFPIVGVVKDFHSKNFYTAIEPLALLPGNSHDLNFHLKLNADPKTWKDILTGVKEKCQLLYPGYDPSLKFMDERIEKLYTKEQNLSKLINLSTGVSIIIGCMGLFGLITLSAFQRIKEIGIRKVLGASIPNIITMLSKNFFQLIFLSTVLAIPLTYWLTHHWLEQFIYKIDIAPWPFIIGLAIVCFAAGSTIAYQALRAAKVNPVDSLRDE